MLLSIAFLRKKIYAYYHVSFELKEVDMSQATKEFRYELVDGGNALDVEISFFCEILFFNNDDPILVHRAKVVGTLYTNNKPQKLNGAYFLSKDDGEWHCNYLASMDTDVPLIWESENSTLQGENGTIRDHLASVIARNWSIEIKTHIEKYALDRQMRYCDFAVENSMEELKRQQTKLAAIKRILEQKIYADLR